MIDFLTSFENLECKKIDNKYISKHDFIVTLGAFSKNIKSNVCIHPFLDVSTDLYIRYEAGTEEGVSALFLYEFYNGNKLDGYINQLDYGYLTSETNISEEEMLYLKGLLNQRRNPLLLIGSDFYIHPKNKNIINIFIQIIKNSKLNIAFLSAKKDVIYEIEKPIDVPLKLVDDLPENNGCIVYIDYDNTSSGILKISNEFAKVWRLKNNDDVEIIFDKFNIFAKCIQDDKFSGVIGILNHTEEIDCGYRYKQVVIKKSIEKR